VQDVKDYGARAARAEEAAAKSGSPVARTFWLLKAMEHRRAAEKAARPKRRKSHSKADLSNQ